MKNEVGIRILVPRHVALDIWRNKSCLRKENKHLTVASAEAQITQLERNGRAQSGSLRVYSCRFCGAYHVGHQQKNRMKGTQYAECTASSWPTCLATPLAFLRTTSWRSAFRIYLQGFTRLFRADLLKPVNIASFHQAARPLLEWLGANSTSSR